VSHIKANNLKEAICLLELQNNDVNRNKWLQLIQNEMAKDVKPGGGKGHLVWVAKHLVCESCSPRVVVFRLEGHKAGARQWAPAVLGLLQNFSKECSTVPLVLKNDGWKKDYNASKNKKTKFNRVILPQTIPKLVKSTKYSTPKAPRLTINDHTAWKIALTILKKDLNVKSYVTWIQTLKLYHAEADIIWLECIDRYAAEFIDANYVDKITSILREATPYKKIRLCTLKR